MSLEDTVYTARKEKGGSQKVVPQQPLTPQQVQELELVLQEFRELLEDIESGRTDKAQVTLDRMAKDVLAIEPGT